MMKQSFMIQPIPATYRRRRGHGRPPKTSPTPPPAALTLVAADYEPDVSVRLTFDRPIDIDELQAAQIIVDDGYAELTRYAGTGAGELVQENIVEILLTAIGPSQGSGMTLTASNSTGIVAADDGGTWAGVTDLGLPFG